MMIECDRYNMKYEESQIIEGCCMLWYAVLPPLLGENQTSPAGGCQSRRPGLTRNGAAPSCTGIIEERFDGFDSHIYMNNIMKN